MYRILLLKIVFYRKIVIPTGNLFRRSTFDYHVVLETNGEK